MHPHSAKNFYSFNQNAYSSDNVRGFNRSPNTNQPSQNRFSSSIYSNMNNLQNLQSLKNQIQQLQTALTTSQQRRNTSAKMSQTKDKSFYSLIKEQLKQVSQIQNSDSQLFGTKISKRNEQPARKISNQQNSKPSTPKGSVLRNSSMILENSVACTGKQQALKKILSTVNKENDNQMQKMEQKFRNQLKNQLKELEDKKQERLIELKEEYERKKQEIEREYQDKVENELELFEKRVRVNLEKRNSEVKMRKHRNSQQQIIKQNKKRESVCMESYVLEQPQVHRVHQQKLKVIILVINIKLRNYIWLVVQRRILHYQIKRRNKRFDLKVIFVLALRLKMIIVGLDELIQIILNFDIIKNLLMGSIYSYVKEHKAVVATTVGALSIVGGLFCKRKYYSSDSSILDESLPIQDKHYPIRKSAYMLEDMEKTLYTTITKAGKIDTIAENIRVGYIGGSECLEPQTIVDILQNTVELAVDDYVSATIKNRQIRRNFKRHGKVNNYQSTIIKYNDEIEEILERAQAELLNRLDIPKDQFEESMLILMERGFFQQLYMLQASVKQKIKEKIQATKELSLKQVKEVIKYNIRLLKERPEPMNCIITRMANHQDYRDLIPNAINLMVQDFIYQQFSIEEEDQIKNLQKPECMGDAELHQLLGQIEQAMTELMNSLGLGGIDNIPDNLETFM